MVWFAMNRCAFAMSLHFLPGLAQCKAAGARCGEYDCAELCTLMDGQRIHQIFPLPRFMYPLHACIKVLLGITALRLARCLS